MMVRLSERLGITEGNAWTATIGFSVAVMMLAIGMPPVFRDDVSASVAPSIVSDEDLAAPVPAASEPASGAVPNPTTSVPAVAVNRSPSAFNPTPSPAQAAAQPTTTTTTTTPATTTTLPTPLTVRTGTWTAASPGDPTVPEGSLPVAMGLGQPDKQSYVRLSGSGTTITFGVSSDVGANRLEAQATILACRVTTDDWSIEPGSPAADGPPHDDANCVEGVRNDDGSTWSFDLGRFGLADRTDDFGFALVPGPGVAFQIALVTT